MLLHSLLSVALHTRVDGGVNLQTVGIEVVFRAVGLRIFLNPSEEETFGMTTIEAMACGTPAIVNCHTALPETVTSPTTGLVVDFSDINATIEAIRRIKALGKNNFINPCRNHIINNYSLSTMTDSYLRLFNEIIK